MLEFKKCSLRDEEMAARCLTVPAYCLEEVLGFVEISCLRPQPPTQQRPLPTRPGRAVLIVPTGVSDGPKHVQLPTEASPARVLGRRDKQRGQGVPAPLQAIGYPRAESESWTKAFSSYCLRRVASILNMESQNPCDEADN